MRTLTDEIEELRTLVLEDAASDRIAGLGLELLRDLAADDQGTARLHPLGFLQIVLASFDEFSLRLHVWPQPAIPAKRPAWRIHRHGWELRSYVICGAVTNREYEVTLDPAGPYRLYDVEHADGVSRLVRTEARASCTQLGEVTTAAPASYGVHRDRFHTSDCCGEGPTATLAVIFSEASKPPVVLGDPEGEPSYPRVMEMIGGPELRSMLAPFRLPPERVASAR